MPKPKVLFADEPTGSLDESSKGMVYEVLRRYVDEDGGLAIVVSHDTVLWNGADVIHHLVKRVLPGELGDRVEAPAGDL